MEDLNTAEQGQPEELAATYRELRAVTAVVFDQLFQPPQAQDSQGVERFNRVNNLTSLLDMKVSGLRHDGHCDQSVTDGAVQFATSQTEAFAFARASQTDPHELGTTRRLRIAARNVMRLLSSQTPEQKESHNYSVHANKFAMLTLVERTASLLAAVETTPAILHAYLNSDLFHVMQQNSDSANIATATLHAAIITRGRALPTDEADASIIQASHDTLTEMFKEGTMNADELYTWPAIFCGAEVFALDEPELVEEGIQRLALYKNEQADSYFDTACYRAVWEISQVPAAERTPGQRQLLETIEQLYMDDTRHYLSREITAHNLTYIYQLLASHDSLVPEQIDRLADHVDNVKYIAKEYLHVDPAAWLTKSDFRPKSLNDKFEESAELIAEQATPEHLQRLIERYPDLLRHKAIRQKN